MTTVSKPNNNPPNAPTNVAPSNAPVIFAGVLFAAVVSATVVAKLLDEFMHSSFLIRTKGKPQALFLVHRRLSRFFRLKKWIEQLHSIETRAASLDAVAAGG